MIRYVVINTITDMPISFYTTEPSAVKHARSSEFLKVIKLIEDESYEPPES